ncbi:ATP-binding protein [Trichocoleus desertorum AS-A10]|uniref:AlbA family DNA-binding domain-containing protein n=1 Tax=Trichocoleus desertorum TaxID=1481672 RepID=UPI0032999894
MAFEIKTTNIELKKSLLKAKEDHFLDLKSTLIAPSKLQTHFVAFANTDGGELIVGIEDVSSLEERIKGFISPEDANEHINTLLSQTKPAVEGVEVEFLNFNKNGFVLRVIVPKSQHVHYTAADECYVRLNASTRRIRGEQITRLSYAKGSYSYERVPVPHVSAEEILESSYLSKYLEKIEAFQESEKFLKKQRLLIQHEGKLLPTVACVLLFDDEPQASLDTRCSIKVYRLQTTEREYKREHLVEMPSTIEGSLEEQINKVKSRVSELLEDVTINLGGKRTKLNYPA